MSKNDNGGYGMKRSSLVLSIIGVVLFIIGIQMPDVSFLFAGLAFGGFLVIYITFILLAIDVFQVATDLKKGLFYFLIIILIFSILLLSMFYIKDDKTLALLLFIISVVTSNAFEYMVTRDSKKNRFEKSLKEHIAIISIIYIAACAFLLPIIIDSLSIDLMFLYEIIVQYATFLFAVAFIYPIITILRKKIKIYKKLLYISLPFIVFTITFIATLIFIKEVGWFGIICLVLTLIMSLLSLKLSYSR